MNKKFLSLISIVFYFSIIMLAVSTVSAADISSLKVMGTDPSTYASNVVTHKDVSISENVKTDNNYVADNTRPKVLAVDPRNNTYNVPTNKIICVGFSETIKLGTGFIELKSSSGTVPITKSIVGRYLYIRHSTTLDRGKRYSLILHTSSVKDLSGKGVASYTTSFLTTNGMNPNPPSKTVKLCFIHHSSGGNWLADGNGNLGAVLNRNHYYVTETNYGWSAQPGDLLGDRTDTVNWPEWFTNAKMPYVYRNNEHSAYTNTIANPGGENEIIMFKSCFPLSDVGSSISDEKAIYNRIKTYFAAHPNKLFVLITPPGTTNVPSYGLTKTLCNWLVDKNGWLNGYTGKNIMVFDFYCVLSEVNSHHRYYNGQIQHVYASNYDGHSPYHDGDDHPNAAGNQKATNEFIKLLNIAYHNWKG